MRQRKIGWVGAIAAMVIAGLIICGIIYWGPDIWRGIREGVAGMGTTSLKSITQDPGAYENQKVAVVGRILGFSNIIDDEGYSLALTNLPSHFYPDIVSKYKVTGKVVHVLTFWDENWIRENYWAIEVSDISKI